MAKNNLTLQIYKDSRTVFTMKEIASLLGELNYQSLKQKINYYVRKGVIINIRRGIYAKEKYNPEELACKLYTPSYISLDYVLRKEGVIFQYSEAITSVSYLARSLEVDSNNLEYRKAKNAILLDVRGINQQIDGINIASPERALLDILYLNKTFYFDNLNPIKRAKIETLLPIYQSERLNRTVNQMYSNT